MIPGPSTFLKQHSHLSVAAYPESWVHSRPITQLESKTPFPSWAMAKETSAEIHSKQYSRYRACIRALLRRMQLDSVLRSLQQAFATPNLPFCLCGRGRGYLLRLKMRGREAKRKDVLTGISTPDPYTGSEPSRWGMVEVHHLDMKTAGASVPRP